MRLRCVGDLGEIKEEIIRLRALPGAWRTNLFASDEELSQWIRRGEAFLLSGKKSFLLMRERGPFRHGHFCTAELADMGETLAFLEQKAQKPVSMDILGEDEKLRETLSQASFRCTATLARMTRQNADMQAENLSLPDDEYARPEELPFLMEQLENTFDPLTKQLPGKEELSRMIEERNVFVVRRKAGIAGFLVSERQGAMLLLRYIAVMEKWRGKAWGGKLLQNFLGIRCGIRKHQLWVQPENIPAVRLYEKCGFRFDGLRDDIYVFRP